METANELLSAMEIRDAIGGLADGQPIDPSLVPFVRAAVHGPCPTADRGEQQFVADISGCSLFNVDTEELIWPQTVHAETGSHVPCGS